MLNLLQNEWTDNIIGFHMTTYRACKNLWKTCVEYHSFYRYVDFHMLKKLNLQNTKL